MAKNSDENTDATLIFERQWLHLLLLAFLLVGCYFAAQRSDVQAGDLWGVQTISWFWIAILIAIMHQVYVWFCWRMELHRGTLSRTIGKNAFNAYAVGFAIIGISRVAAIFFVAIANQGSIALDPLPFKIAAVIAVFPVAYLFYSIKRYFGFHRALGADHFDPAIRNLPFVRKGIFRFTSNSMYVYGFLMAWIPALWWASSSALVVALFNHLYIWVHYHATERPDFRHIY